MQETEVNIPLLHDGLPTKSDIVEDNLQFMENSYKFENSPTTSIDLSKESTSVSDNRTHTKGQETMSLPVNVNLASPVIRLLWKYINTYKDNSNIVIL